MRGVLLTIFLLSLFCSYAQTDSISNQSSIKKIRLHTGLGFSKKIYLDFGLAKVATKVVGHHPFQSALFVSNEIYFDKNVILAPKIGGWFAGGASIVGLGLNLLYYTNFDQGRAVLRPEIGIGFLMFRLIYGYNINFGNSIFQPFNNSVFGITVWMGKF